MQVIFRPIWIVALLAHGAAAVAWWWSMPGGFPVDHPRFWINAVAPACVLAAVVAAFVAWRKQRLRAIQSILLAFALMWLAGAASTRLIFPISSRLVAPVMFVAGLLTLVAALCTRPPEKRWLSWALACAAVGALFGALMPLTQRSASPSTRPLNLGEPIIEALSMENRKTLVFLGPMLNVQMAEGVVALRGKQYEAYVEPMLTFNSLSPDRCWTMLSDQPQRFGSRHAYGGMMRTGANLVMAFNDDGPGVLRVSSDDDHVALIDAISTVPRPVYSHLNSFCVVSLFGHSRPSVGFSPCPDVRVPVSFADYPVGRPAKLAYMTAAGEFHIVQAASAEKGPFTQLATGKLARGEPLTLTFYDGDRLVARAVLEDWTAQASTALSPTAGWGVTQNAIEFGLEKDYPESAVNVFFTLASTSVGRGFDSVGHAAGTYRNRVKVELLE